MKSQSNQILEYLQGGKALTAIKALEMFQCFRLAARILDLRKKGFQIEAQMIKVESGKEVASYSLADNA